MLQRIAAPMGPLQSFEKEMISTGYLLAAPPSYNLLNA